MRDQQAADAQADVPALPGASATRRIFGAVVDSQLPAAGTAIVTMRASTPRARVRGRRRADACRSPPADRSRCASTRPARAVGRARVQMTVQLGDETDAFEDVIPVEVLVSPETVAAYGEAADANATATETRDDAGRRRARLRRPARRAVVDGDGRARRRRALPRRVPVRLRRAARRRARSRWCSRPISATRSRCRAWIPPKMRPAAQQTLKELENVPVRERRLRLLAGRLLGPRRRTSRPTCCTSSRRRAT